MSQENVELVRKLLDMFARRDHEAVFAFMPPISNGMRRTSVMWGSTISRGSIAATRGSELIGGAGCRRGRTFSSRSRTWWMPATKS